MTIHSDQTKTSSYRALTLGTERVDVLRAAFDPNPFESHFHDFPTIGLVRKGANKFKCGGNASVAKRGELCIVNPGDVHDGGRAGVDWAYDCLFPSSALMIQLAQHEGLNSYPWIRRSCLTGPRVARFIMFFDAVFRPGADYTIKEDCEQLCALALIDLITHEATSTRTAGKLVERRVARDAIAYIQDNLDAPLFLADIATAVSASGFTVIRAVNAETGLTPRRLIIQMRVERARQMLIAGKDISTTAFATGFADQSHLSREMKKRWGVSPGVFTKGSGRPLICF